MPKHISIETKEALVEEYKRRPITLKDISERYGVCQPVASKILAQYRVKTWSKEKLFSPDLDEGYFETIDTQEKAYYLGFITTDGCVFWKNKKNAFLNVTQKSGDGYILEDFMSAVKCNRKLVYDKKKDVLSATVTSTRMVVDLEKYGIFPRSSLTQRFWSEIPKAYLSSYLRGIIDGDGSFAYYARPKRSVHRKELCICSGSINFLSELMDTVCEAYNISRPSIYSSSNQNCHDIRWKRNDDLETIIGSIYSVGGPRIERKKAIADKILQEIRQYRDNGCKAAS